MKKIQKIKLKHQNINKSENKESSFGFIDDFDTEKKLKSVKPKKKEE